MQVFAIGLLLLFTHQAQARYCEPFKKSSAQEIKTAIEKIEESPFAKACKSPPSLLKDRPSTGLFKRDVVEKDKDNRTTRDFLKKLIAKVRARISEGRNQNQSVQDCLKSTANDCSEINSWIHKELPDYVNSARYHLSLAQSPNELKTHFGSASIFINEDLDALGSYKFVDWNPLTKKEKQRAEKTLKDYRSEITTSVAKEFNEKDYLQSQNIRDFKNQAMMVVRYQHYKTYHDMMAALPIMQYLKGNPITQENLSAAFSQMEEHLKKEELFLSQMQAKLDKSGTLDPDVLELLNYSTEVESALLEEPKDCGLAASLVFTMTNRQIGNAVAIGLPMMALSFFAPPLVGFGVGAAAGTAFAFNSYTDFAKSRQQKLGYIYGAEDGREFESLSSSARQKNFDIMTLPMGMGLMGLAGKAYKASSNAVGSAAKFFKPY